MTKLLHSLMLAAVVSGLSSLPARADSSDLDSLQGKWSVQKTNQEGRRYSYVMDVKKDAFTFQLLDSDGKLRLFTKGTAKTEQSGPIKLLTFFDMQAGRTTEDLAPVNDRRVAVYTLIRGKLHLVTNFDKDRNNESPALDVYTRVEGLGKIEVPADPMNQDAVVGNWKLEVTQGDATRDYTLRIEKAEGNLAATFISPRSGESKCKSAVVKDNRLVVEIDRGFGGTQIYEAKLVGGHLEGTITRKSDGENTGSFTGSK